MSELQYAARMREEEMKQQATLAEAASKKYEDDYVAALEAVEEMRMAAARRRDHFIEYKSNVKKKLLSEALKRIYVGSIKNPTVSEKSLCEALLGNFIEERGVDELLEGFARSRTHFLSVLESAVNKYYNIVMEEVDEEDEDTMVLDRDHIQDFMDEIEDKEDIEDITATIRMRIADAEEQFVNRNDQDKHNLDDILKSTAQRVADAKPDNDNEYGEDEEQEDDEEETGEDGMSTEMDDEVYEMALMRQRMDAVLDRPRSVFDRMVRNVSEAAIKDPELRKQYSENGRLDMNKVVESVRCMYGLLEMVNTLQIERVDEKYIEDTIKSING